MESRYTDNTPVECLNCGWQGLVSECVHTYSGIVFGEEEDVEPSDECPNCNSDYLVEVKDERDKV